MKKFVKVCTFPSSLSCDTSVNDGSGFQIPGVWTLSGTCEQVTFWSCSQSGSEPWKM